MPSILEAHRQPAFPLLEVSVDVCRFDQWMASCELGGQPYHSQRLSFISLSCVEAVNIVISMADNTNRTVVEICLSSRVHGNVIPDKTTDLKAI